MILRFPPYQDPDRHLIGGLPTSGDKAARTGTRLERQVLDTEAPGRSVEADIGYLLPSSTINRRFCSRHADVNTGRYRNYPVVVRDGQPIADTFKADVHGFEFLRIPTGFSDFTDPEAVKTVYEAEHIELIKRFTGADRVISLGCALRTAGDPVERDMQPPASEAHVDFETRAAIAYARALYEENFPEGPGYSRFIASSLWRPIAPPPHDWPIAVVDFRSVKDDEGTRNVMVVVDELPTEQEMLDPIEGEDDLPAASIFPFNPDHRWWYFSGMTPADVLFIKFHDSDHRRAWRCIHSAFHNKSVEHPNTRESIEMRTMAYFL